MKKNNFLLTRQSIPPQYLNAPIPNTDEMDYIFKVAMRAPDHGAFRPFRFQILKGDDRIKLGEIFAQALLLRSQGQTISNELLENEKMKPLRAPMVIIVSAKLVMNNPKVPPIEQHLTVGCAVQNMLNAIHMLGYGGIFLTGKNTYDPYVLKALGFTEKHPISGFLYVGSIAEKMIEKTRPDYHQYLLPFSADLP